MAPKNKGGGSGGKEDKSKDAKGKGKDSAAKGKGNSTTSTKDASSSNSKLKPATSINVRHILCAKQSRSLEAQAALQSGRKFDDVARDFSEDKARQGGALGWKTRGSLLADFEKVAYELEPSTTAAPKWAEVKTGEGYHIVMVEGRK